LQNELEAAKDNAVRTIIGSWYAADLLKNYRGSDPATGATVPVTEYTQSEGLTALVRIARSEAERGLILEVINSFRTVMGRPIDVGSMFIYISARLAGDSISSIEEAIRQTSEYQNGRSSTCAGMWSPSLFSVGQTETHSSGCPTNQSGSIVEAHTCTAANTWGPITVINSCTDILSTPRNVSAESKSDGIHVSWSASTGATGYHVWREISPEQPQHYASTVEANYIDTDVRPNNQY